MLQQAKLSVLPGQNIYPTPKLSVATGKANLGTAMLPRGSEKKKEKKGNTMYQKEPCKSCSSISRVLVGLTHTHTHTHTHRGVLVMYEVL